MKTKILHIEKLRGISILLVLLFHLEIPGFQFGYYGVDVFFVISGFLMSSLYGDIATKPEIGNYLLRRCARILPAYYVVIVVTSIAGIFMLLPHEVAMLMKQSLWSAFLLPNFGYWRDAAYFDYTLFRPLLNLWSLGVELQFYLLFPLLLFIERQSHRLLFVIVVLSFLEYGVFSSIDPSNAFYLLPGRIWEFMAGFYACKYAFTESEKNPQAGNLYLLGFLIGIPALSFFEFENNFILTCLVVLGSFDMIRHGFRTGSESNPASRFLLFLGKYSYSIYLVHFPVIVLMNYAPFGGTSLAASSITKLAITVTVTTLLSVLLHHGVELRMRGSLSPRKLFASSLSCAAAITALSIAAPMLNLSSLTIEEINISNALLDRDSSRCERSESVVSLFRFSCVLTEPADEVRKRFMLHGDSHADGIKLPLSEMLARQGHGLIITGDYSAVNSVNNNAKVIAEAVGQDVDVIVLHQLAQADNGEALEDFVTEARQRGLQIAYIAPVPTYGYAVPSKLITDLGDGMSQPSLGIELQSHLERNKLLFNTIEELVRTFDNFTWYQSADYLCNEYCNISSEEWIPYYFDSNHLTLTGAHLLAPAFESISLL